MAPPHSLKKTKAPKDDSDFISKLPTNVAQKILKKLPLSMATRTSVLSKTWKDNWLSLKNLVFDADFSEGQKENISLDGKEYCNIITNILLFHKGHVHKFYLVTDNMMFKTGCLNLGPWLSFLSKNGVKKMVLNNWFSNDPVSITSHIYHCTDLVKLRLVFVTLSYPPTNFEGFADLLKLELVEVSLINCEQFQSLIAKCPRLEILSLVNCYDIDHIVIDSPSLKTLVIEGACESLSFKNFPNGFSVTLCLIETKKDSLTTKLADAMMMLATSLELQFLHLQVDLSKFFFAGSITKLLGLEFDNLVRLSLEELNIESFSVFYSTCYLVDCCPNIKDLHISVASSKNFVQHKYVCYEKELAHLRTVKIMGITGTIAELKLIEHLLAISVVLENLFYKCRKLYADSELKMSRKLMKFPRASPKAQLVYLQT